MHSGWKKFTWLTAIHWNALLPIDITVQILEILLHGSSTHLRLIGLKFISLSPVKILPNRGRRALEQAWESSPRTNHRVHVWRVRKLPPNFDSWLVSVWVLAVAPTHIPTVPSTQRVRALLGEEKTGNVIRFSRPSGESACSSLVWTSSSLFPRPSRIKTG